jgi:phosphatidylinositol glycan class U
MIHGTTKMNADDRYLFNPYTLMTCLSRSTTSIDNTMLLSAISLAANGELTESV